MKNIFLLLFVLSVLILNCGDMDKTLKNSNFLLKGPYISEKGLFFINPAINSLIKIDAETGKVKKIKLTSKIFSIIEQLLPSIFVVSIDEDTGNVNIIEFDESGSEKRRIKLGSPFTSFELSKDKEYLIMRHSSKTTDLEEKNSSIYFKNEIGILELKTGTLKKTTLNFSISDVSLIVSEPSSHLLAFLCKEGIIVMDYTNPSKTKYIYLDINKKSPEIDYALFSKTGKYLFLKTKSRDDIYSLSIDNQDDDIHIKVNVPSSPYKGLVFIKPVTIENSEDTCIAQYTYPNHTLVIISAESNSIYQNKISLDSGSYIIDTIDNGKFLFVTIINYWLKYIKVISLYPIAENIKDEVKVFADDFKILGYSELRDLILLQYEGKGLSIRHIRPEITEKVVKIKSKEFSFNPINNLFNYSPNFNIFYFVSSLDRYSSDRYVYQFNYINLNNNNIDKTELEYLPSHLFNIDELSFFVNQNEENDVFSLINFKNEEKVITYSGLKYNELTEY